MKKVYGTGDGSSLIFYLNGFSHDKIESLNLASFLVGVSDAESVFDMKYSSTMVKAGQVTSGQSYKHFTIIIYDSRVVPDWKIPHFTTLES